MTFVASSVAIWGRVCGHGLFAAPTTQESLMLVQLFMGLVAIMHQVHEWSGTGQADHMTAIVIKVDG
jgi:hypothetical protein